jgi:hypothetical protein
MFKLRTKYHPTFHCDLLLKNTVLATMLSCCVYVIMCIYVLGLMQARAPPIGGKKNKLSEIQTTKSKARKKKRNRGRKEERERERNKARGQKECL